MKQEEWADRLEQQLKDYQVMPSHDLWQDIEVRLDKTSKRPHIVMLRRWVAAAAIVGVLMGGFWLYWNRQQKSEVMPPSVQTGTVTEVKNNYHEDSLPDSVQNQEPVPMIPVRSVPAYTVPTLRAQIAEEKREDVLPVSQEDETSFHEPREDAVISSNDAVDVSPENNNHLWRAFGRGKKSRRSHMLAMNMYVSGDMSSWESRNGVQMNPSLLREYHLSRSGNTEADVWLTGYEERQGHDRPVSFGLTVSYPFTDRLAVSSGLVYTKLNSDFVSIMQENQVHRHQTLHYVGIPLNLQFALWRWRDLNVYLTGGGQADWNIKAKATTDGIDQVMSKDRMQWSIGGGLGVQYSILPQLGIYAEPGIRYYFDNGSSVSNFFKDKPTDFHLELGFRFQWQ